MFLPIPFNYIPSYCYTMNFRQLLEFSDRHFEGSTQLGKLSKTDNELLKSYCSVGCIQIKSAGKFPL